MGYRHKLPRARHHLSTLQLIVFALAAIWFAVAARGIVRAAAPLTWQITSGRISASTAKEVFVGLEAGRSGNRMRYEKRFFVRYDYTVGGQSYVGTRIDAFSAEGHRYPLTGEQRFPLDAVVPVHYNPRSPGEAVLEVTTPWAWAFALLCATALGCLALWALAPIEPQEMDEEQASLIA